MAWGWFYTSAYLVQDWPWTGGSSDMLAAPDYFISVSGLVGSLEPYFCTIDMLWRLSGLVAGFVCICICV
jgi:hypothetical protein